MFTFVIDYYILSLMLNVAVIQISASIGNISNLLFIKNTFATRVIGAILITAGFAIFFGTANRNVNDNNGGMDSNDQALYFFLGLMSAWLVTVSISSIINRDQNKQCLKCKDGLESLRKTTYIPALMTNLLNWQANWRILIKNYFFG